MAYVNEIPLPEPMLSAIGLAPEARPDLPRWRVAPLDAPVGRVWLKTVEPPTKVGWTKALSVLAKILPVPILRPSLAGKGGDTLLKQVEQAEVLRRAGFNPANVLYGSRELLVVEDGGVNLETLVHDLEKHGAAAGDMDRTAIRSVLLQVTAILARLHARGLAHGRPKMRDFAWKRAGTVGDGRPADGKITILDLEERPWEVMPMAAAQARDVFLWLTDLCGFPVSREVAPEAMRLLLTQMSKETLCELRRLRRLLAVPAGPVRLITKTPMRRRETVRAIAAYDVLRAALSPK